MEKSMKIVPPAGYEIDKKNSTFECIRFKPVEPYLPKTWEEFCSLCPTKEGEAFISSLSGISQVHAGDREYLSDRNVLPSVDLARAVLALCQLVQLRDYYNGNWSPDWTDFKSAKHCIGISKNELIKFSYCMDQRVLAFKTTELRDEFLKNFKDLIEVAKPLL